MTRLSRTVEYGLMAGREEMPPDRCRGIPGSDLGCFPSVVSLATAPLRFSACSLPAARPPGGFFFGVSSSRCVAQEVLS